MADNSQISLWSEAQGIRTAVTVVLLLLIVPRVPYGIFLFFLIVLVPVYNYYQLAFYETPGCSEMATEEVCKLYAEGVQDCSEFEKALDRDVEFKQYLEAYCAGLPASTTRLELSYSARFFPEGCDAEIQAAQAKIAGVNSSMCSSAPVFAEPSGFTTVASPLYLAVAGGIGVLLALFSNFKIGGQGWRQG